MQPGEVIYLESFGLLYYVQSVNHSFTYGSTFQTTLTLTYGHTPGEYIPSFLDLMGKAIYNNKSNNDIVNYRQHDSSNQTNLGCFQLDGANPDFNGLSQSNLTTLQKYNAQTFKNIMYTASYIINQNSDSSNVNVMLELRLYSKDGSTNAKLIDFATSIRDYAIQGLYANVEQAPVPLIDAQNITVSEVNLTDSQFSPSQKAWDLARDNVRNEGYSNSFYRFSVKVKIPIQNLHQNNIKIN
jgi:hypothetical protein